MEIVYNTLSTENTESICYLYQYSLQLQSGWQTGDVNRLWNLFHSECLSVDDLLSTILVLVTAVRDQPA